MSNNRLIVTMESKITTSHMSATVPQLWDESTDRCAPFDQYGSDDMHRDPSDLISAVRDAYGKELDIRDSGHRLIVHKGCYILNSWGFQPEYGYRRYVRGPYSEELAEDMAETWGNGRDTTIPSDTVGRLSGILRKGEDHIVAYATLLMVKNNNPSVDRMTVIRKAIGIKPGLEKEILEASEEIFE